MYQFTQKRTPLGIVYPYIQQLKNWLANLPEVENVEIAGSTRRMKETV
jgi:DNA polymerase/3'-5' exonuclease PolX